MSELTTVECERCASSFVVHPDSNAAASGYCSPACATEGKGLA